MPANRVKRLRFRDKINMIQEDSWKITSTPRNTAGEKDNDQDAQTRQQQAHCFTLLTPPSRGLREMSCFAGYNAKVSQAKIADLCAVSGSAG